jgi:putative effector of murein hydrolase
MHLRSPRIIAFQPPIHSLTSVAQMTKIITIIVGGFLFSLLSTCYSVTAVSKLFGTSDSSASIEATTTEKAAVSSHAQTAAPKAFSDELTYGSRTLMALSGLAAIVSNSAGSTLTTPLLAFSMLMATVHNFAFGARQPKKFIKAIHPLVSCTALSWVWGYILGAATGGSLTGMLQGYRVGGALSVASSGAGDYLTFVLGPAVVSLGVSIYERRVLIKQNFKEVLTATFVSCVGGLFGTAFVVRLLGLASAELRLSMLPRNITSALAVAIAEIVGANKSLAVAIAIVTGLIGANFGASLLDVFGIKDPVTRGLGIGSAAHGLGTAAFVDEKDAFPFAAISMALTAICGTLLVSVPAVKALAIRIALGGLA